MTLTGRVWPIHPKPLDDEMLSSWLVRIAILHGLEPSAFANIIWPVEQIWKHDIDKLADKKIVGMLAKKMATAPERVAQTTLRWYEGRLYEKHNSRGNTAWIMPLGIFSRSRKLYGLQFCPFCLAESELPYYRKKWRLACITACVEHGTALLDSCPACNSPIHFHLSRDSVDQMARCGRCGFDLRSATHCVSGISAGNIKRQRKLLDIMEAGWVEIPGVGPVYSHLYFNVLHLLTRLLYKEKRREKPLGLRRHLVRYGFPKDEEVENSDRLIEWLRIEERLLLVDMASWLLTQWPQRFLRICKELGIWKAYILHSVTMPYWFAHVVNEKLSNAVYVPTEREVDSVIIFLRAEGIQVSGKKISSMLGVHKIFKHRQKPVL